MYGKYGIAALRTIVLHTVACYCQSVAFVGASVLVCGVFERFFLILDYVFWPNSFWSHCRSPSYLLPHPPPGLHANISVVLTVLVVIHLVAYRSSSFADTWFFASCRAGERIIRVLLPAARCIRSSVDDLLRWIMSLRGKTLQRLNATTENLREDPREDTPPSGKKQIVGFCWTSGRICVYRIFRLLYVLILPLWPFMHADIPRSGI